MPHPTDCSITPWAPVTISIPSTFQTTLPIPASAVFYTTITLSPLLSLHLSAHAPVSPQQLRPPGTFLPARPFAVHDKLRS
ncbi:hypothetical protein E2C01_038869 [Portunus trituberculatus]|uniref:Uncharacterized protein n=1 Tax=Portunus trituberculatus TaxID=210409 RepID=A0A5B7FJ43_PORTR|nr:hypothetical protein [Portunus trituberculatus]